MPIAPAPKPYSGILKAGGPGRPPKVTQDMIGALAFKRWEVGEDERINKHSGPEDYFSLDLALCLAGLPPESPIWKTAGDGIGALCSGAGSGNIPLLLLAVRTIVAYRSGDKAGMIRCRSLWRLIFERYATGWMISEVGSRIYWQWHLIPIATLVWLLAQSGDPEDAWIVAQSRLWLAQWWAWMRLCEDAGGRILMVGMRSGGHVPQPGMLELALAIGLDRGAAAEARWLQASDGTGQGLRTKWERFAMAGPLRAVLRETGAKVAAGETPAEWLAACPQWPVLTPFHFASWGDNGHAVWADRNINPNTTPVLGAVVSNEGLHWLPENGGAHIRQQMDQASCVEHGGRLLYESSLQGSQSVALPTGSPLWRMTWGPGGAS